IDVSCRNKRFAEFFNSCRLKRSHDDMLVATHPGVRSDLLMRDILSSSAERRFGFMIFNISTAIIFNISTAIPLSLDHETVVTRLRLEQHSCHDLVRSLIGSKPRTLCVGANRETQDSYGNPQDACGGSGAATALLRCLALCRSDTLKHESPVSRRYI